MNTTTTKEVFRAGTAFRSMARKEHFREKFQRSLRSCVKRGFTVEESFGMIWLETWEDIPITEADQAELYDEMIKWAKTARF